MYFSASVHFVNIIVSIRLISCVNVFMLHAHCIIHRFLRAACAHAELVSPGAYTPEDANYLGSVRPFYEDGVQLSAPGGPQLSVIRLAADALPGLSFGGKYIAEQGGCARVWAA